MINPQRDFEAISSDIIFFFQKKKNPISCIILAVIKSYDFLSFMHAYFISFAID
jgi:hypothetical protein